MPILSYFLNTVFEKSMNYHLKNCICKNISLFEREIMQWIFEIFRCFWYLRKAFDSVDHCILWTIFTHVLLE